MTSSAPMRPLAFAVVVACVAACRGKPSREECHQMLERYVEMEIARDPALAQLHDQARTAALDMKMATSRAHPAFAQVADRCEREVSGSELRCAMKAETPEQWEACIE